uniref:CD209 antigen-like protein E n=1 Tax=Sinocyclocheilus grahami TaxID=75366 RepID=A0A672NPA1_SINGR
NHTLLLYVIMRTETMEMDRGERVEMMVAIYDSADTVRHHDLRTHAERRQPLQHTGSVSVKNRKHRAAEVCLCLLCFLLLIAVIVLCVCFTSERKQLLTHISNLTEEREKTLTKHEQVLYNNNNLTEERKQILSKYEQILNHNNKLTKEREQIFTNNIKLIQIKKTGELQQGLLEQEDPFKWIYYNFSFYYISSEKKSWSDSSRDCQQKGADLVIINSSKEQDFVQKIAVSDHFWIGLGKMEGEWKWIGGTIMNLLHCCFRYWSSQYLHSYGSYCALITSSGWIDDKCDYNKKWICKRRILT